MLYTDRKCKLGAVAVCTFVCNKHVVLRFAVLTASVSQQTDCFILVVIFKMNIKIVKKLHFILVSLGKEKYILLTLVLSTPK
jgi:hypothetical protein